MIGGHTSLEFKLNEDSELGSRPGPDSDIATRPQYWKDYSEPECDECITIFKCICHKYLFGHVFLLIFTNEYI